MGGKTDDGGERALTRLAPFGVATGPEDPTAEESPLREGSFRIVAYLPGFVGSEVKLDVVGVGPGRLPIDELASASEIQDLPEAKLEVTLKRLSDDLHHEGSQIYRSEEIFTYADLRAAAKYLRSDEEDDLCHHCLPRNFLPSETLELLSGHFVQVRFSDSARNQLRPIYGNARLDEAELELESVPWDISPSVRQEPTLNPSYGSGDVAPGTLLHSGEMTMTSTDVAIRGRGFDFAFTRTYRSGIVGGGPLGTGCDHNYRPRLRPLPDGDVEYFDGRGRRELFRFEEGAGPEGSDIYKAAGRFVDLKRTSTGWVLIDAQHNLARFDAFGRLISLADTVKESPTTGNEMRFHYDVSSRLVAVTDTLDRVISFEYDVGGQLIRITDFTDRAFNYEYDLLGRLVAFRTPAVATADSAGAVELETSYTWATPFGNLDQQLNLRNNLKDVTDAKSQSWLKLTFGDQDSDNRDEEIASQIWGGHTLNVNYDFTARQTTVTDRRGNDCVYTFNEEGQMLSLKDPTQAMWEYEYDDEGRLTKETLPLGRTTERTYDVVAEDRRNQGNVLTIRVTPDSRGANGSPSTLETTYEYDETTNQPTKIVDPRGAVTAIDRASSGLPEQVRQAEGAQEVASWSYTYNAFGQVERATNPNGNVTQYEYFPEGNDAAGYVQKITESSGGLNLVTTFERDKRGNVEKIIDPRSIAHTRDYNALDWLVSTTAAATALDYVTDYKYDRNGNLAEAHLPFGGSGGEILSKKKVTYVYGILDEITEVTREIDGTNAATTKYKYDKNFNRTETTDPVSNVVKVDYDTRNVPAKVTTGFGSLTPIVETPTYNKDRELTDWENGLGNTWTTEYDGYGRVKKTQDPLGNHQTAKYDGNGNVLLQEAKAAGGLTLAASDATYDLLNRRVESKRLLDSQWVVEQIRYDAASNVIETQDALGRVTHYTYDAAERLTEVTDPLGNRQVLTLDEMGNVTSTASQELGASGSVTITNSAVYDALNRLTSSTDGVGNTTLFQPDARGLVRQVRDAAGQTTQRDYDALDRLTQETLPEGIVVSHAYDLASRRTQYLDALNNKTTWTYDAVNRVTQVIYADGTSVSYTYDAAHNARQIVDQRGITVAQGYDAANRLISRSATPPVGLTLYGPVLESYGYDGLNRLTGGTSGSVVTTRGFDTGSRLKWETTGSRTVSYDYDIVDNVRQITYPSGLVLGHTVDALNRAALIGPVGGTRSVQYGFRGPNVVESKSFGAGLTTTQQHDNAYRLTEQATVGALGTVYSETLGRDSRHLKVRMVTVPPRIMEMSYDGARRLLEAVEVDPAKPPEESRGEGFGFGYDAAQNLLARQVMKNGEVSETHQFPLELSSGRNRPDSIVTPSGTTDLDYDGAGNLTKKGEYEYHYDFRNRLARVTQSGIEVALYDYDVFNRRVRKVLPSEAYEEQETVWSGWRELEQYTNGLLEMRYTRGLGIDEVVRIEVDEDGDGIPGTELIPHYDDTGNVVALTGSQDEVLLRYDYTPFGGIRLARKDSTPPTIDQLAIEGDSVALDLSEGSTVSEDEVELRELPPSSNLESGAVKSTPISVTVELSTTGGRRARQRIVITPTVAVAPGIQLELNIQPDGIQDDFLNPLADPYNQVFTWPDPMSGTTIVADETAPEVDELRLNDGHLEISFSEPPDLLLASTSIKLDGETTTWLIGEDAYTLKSKMPLVSETFTVRIEPGDPIDRAGKGVEVTLEETITVTAEAPNEEYYVAPDPRETSVSAFANRFTFHGRTFDDETGLLYFRNRHYDPEIGRFISADPLEYIDGPSMYAFAGYSPHNSNDPLGLENWRATLQFSEKEHQRRLEELRRKREEELESDLALETILILSTLKLEGVDVSGLVLGTFIDQAEKYYQKEFNMTYPEARNRTDMLVGKTGCVDENRVLCNIQLKEIANFVRGGEVVLQASLVVFDPIVLAFPAKPVNISRWRHELDAFRNGSTSRLVIGKLEDLKKFIRPGERTLFNYRALNRGSHRANWAQNSSALRREMAKRRPIRDVSVHPNGKLREVDGFLAAERGLLRAHGWEYDQATTLWMPPP